MATNSYNVAQLRRNEISSYSTNITYNLEKVKNENTVFNFSFDDQCLKLNSSISSLFSYYLKFKVQHREDSVQNFSIKLKNDSSEEETIQLVRTLSTKIGPSDDWDTYEIIFNPNSDYNMVVFELTRIADDFKLVNTDGTSGRIMEIEVLNFCQVTNIINSYLSTKYSGLTTLKKIGIQGPPGLMFVLDGEEMRIGRRGIYELYYEGIEISYIGFIINDSSFTQDGKDYFIMDFKY